MRRVWETIMDWEGRRAALWMWIWRLDSWDAQSWQERSCRRRNHETTLGRITSIVIVCS
ncbi:hypothetical protein EV363DRAFT_1182808 [Boletus edulis]|nr:hypothetical protein EV363DRAFT_1182808 [Boletus edulis]